MQLKREGEQLRKTRARMCRDMPTMPFDLWFEMKREEAQEEAQQEAAGDFAPGEDGRVERRRRYQSLGMARRATLKLTSKQLKEAASLGGGWPGWSDSPRATEERD